METTSYQSHIHIQSKREIFTQYRGKCVLEHHVYIDKGIEISCVNEQNLNRWKKWMAFDFSSYWFE